MIRRVVIAICFGLALFSFLSFLASADLDEGAGDFHSAMVWGILGWLTVYSKHEPAEEESAPGALPNHRRIALAFLMFSLGLMRLVRRARRWCFRGQEPGWAVD